MEDYSYGRLLMSGVVQQNESYISEAFACSTELSQQDVDNAMGVACEFSKLDALKQMVEKHGVAIRIQSVWAACRNGKWEIIEYLMQRGIEFGEVEKDMLDRCGHHDTKKRLMENKM